MADVRGLPFTKGHGTENDFVLVPDPHGALDLTPERVRRLADRRAGIGADGVIRVVPTARADEPQVRAQADQARWFMDYRNADGSAAQTCGNGTRVFAAYLVREGLVPPEGDFAIATRAGVKVVHPTPDGGYAVELGPWRVPGEPGPDGRDGTAVVRLDGADLPGLRVEVGNPHVVVVLPPTVELADLDLSRAPQVTPTIEGGANVELVRELGPGRLAMRVHERGVGETRSCGTGAVAAAVAVHWRAGHPPGPGQWEVRVPGGRLRVLVGPGERAVLAGPAVLVADGTLRDGDHPWWTASTR